MQTEALYQAVLTAFNQKNTHDADTAASARSFTNILVAFAAVIAPPVVAVEGVALVADDTPKLILAELQKQNDLLGQLVQFKKDSLICL